MIQGWKSLLLTPLFTELRNEGIIGKLQAFTLIPAWWDVHCKRSVERNSSPPNPTKHPDPGFLGFQEQESIPTKLSLDALKIHSFAQLLH